MRLSHYSQYNIQGVDVVWHNHDRDDDSDVTIFRQPCDKDVNWVFLMMARRVEQRLYWILNISASKHSFAIVCDLRKKWYEMPEG
jgi:hypothetical protein